MREPRVTNRDRKPALLRPPGARRPRRPRARRATFTDFASPSFSHNRMVNR